MRLPSLSVVSFVLFGSLLLSNTLFSAQANTRSNESVVSAVSMAASRELVVGLRAMPRAAERDTFRALARVGEVRRLSPGLSAAVVRAEVGRPS